MSQSFCIETSLRPEHVDVHAARIRAQAREIGLAVPDGLATRRGYSLQVPGGEADARALGERLLADAVLETARVLPTDASPCEPDTRRLEVVRRPGVMDPVAQSIVRAAAALGIEVSSVRSWSAFVFPASVSTELLEQLGSELLANAAIEDVRIDPTTGIAPMADLPDVPFHITRVPLLEADDAALERISAEGCLALDLVEMRAVQSHFVDLGRDPTDLELETLAQTWSEHCKHKTLTGIVNYDGEIHDNLLTSMIGRATHELDRDFCKSVFVDNAGVVSFDENFHLTFKVETHNHPSAIEPYGGAGTGLGGVIRDTLGTGLGARPVASTDVFCFGPPDLTADELPKGCMHPRRIMKGVVAGVRDYGNRMGIPTVNGAVCFDERYVGNPLVYCGSIGLLPVDRLEKHVEPGDLIVVAGGRTGRDGIHGATFSSLELHEESETASSGAVQIGNAIEEKRVLDAMITARDRGLYRCVTDCGAGGLSSAVGEMGETTGADVDLDTVPLKYHGLTYAEVWISEAQERMVYAVPPEHRDEILALFKSEDVEAVVIGTFTDTGRLVARSHGEVVMDLSMAYLHDGLPRQERPATKRVRDLTDPSLPGDVDVATTTELLTSLLSAPNIASKEWIIRQYDHEVQGGSVLKPLVGVRRDGPGDAAVVAPVLGSRRGFAVGCGLNPKLGDVDPYQMSLHAIDEALRNVTCVGGDPNETSILDNFSWGRCDEPRNLGDLVEACKACYDGGMAYRTPFISGKDSLNNDYRSGGVSRSIPPTLLISALAPVDDILDVVSMDMKSPGSTLIVVGDSGAELGGSHLAEACGALGTAVPPVNLTVGPAVMRAVHELIVAGRLLSCHDLSEGGLAVALAEMAFAGEVGALVDVAKLPLREGVSGLHPWTAAFGESPSRFVLEVAADEVDAVTAVLGSLPHAVIGTTHAEHALRVVDGDLPLIDAPLERLREAFVRPLDLDAVSAETSPS